MRRIALLSLALFLLQFDGCASMRSSLTVSADAKANGEESPRPEYQAHVAYRIDFGGE